MKDTTFSDVFVPGHEEVFIHTLEDTVREQSGVPVEQWKIDGKTAIPSGRYKVSRVNSPRFGRDTLSLDNVPGFTVIRIHAGNDDSDTEGCLIAGTTVILDPKGDGGNVGGSRIALQKLKDYLIPKLKDGEVVWWNVINPIGGGGGGW